jgi:hypothetical protein
LSEGEKEVLCEKLLELNPIKESKEFETEEEEDKENAVRASGEKGNCERISLRKMSEDSYFNFIM